MVTLGTKVRTLRELNHLWTKGAGGVLLTEPETGGRDGFEAG